MFKMTKLSDYAVVLMQAVSAGQKERQSASELSSKTKIQLATTRKLLKLLQKARLIDSVLGPDGGYYLARAANKIRLSDMVAAIDHQLALTDCQTFDAVCIAKKQCGMRSHWQRLNGLLLMILQQITLADLKRPDGTPDWKLSADFMQQLQHMGYVEQSSLMKGEKYE